MLYHKQYLMILFQFLILFITNNFYFIIFQMQKNTAQTLPFSPNINILHSPFYPLHSYRQNNTPHHQFQDITTTNINQPTLLSEATQQKNQQQKEEKQKQYTLIKLLMSQSSLSQQCSFNPIPQKTNHNDNKNLNEANISEVVPYAIESHDKGIGNENYEYQNNHQNIDMKKKNNNRSINAANNIINNDIIDADNHVNNSINSNDMHHLRSNENFNQNKLSYQNVKQGDNADDKESKFYQGNEKNNNISTDQQKIKRQIKYQYTKYCSQFRTLPTNQQNSIQAFIKVLTSKQILLKRYTFQQIRQNSKHLQPNQKKQIKHKYASPKDINQNSYPLSIDSNQPLPAWSNYSNYNNNLKKIKTNNNSNYDTNQQEIYNNHQYQLPRSRRKHIFTIENANQLPSSIKQETTDKNYNYNYNINNNSNSNNNNNSNNNSNNNNSSNDNLNIPKDHQPTLPPIPSQQQSQYTINIIHPPNNTNNQLLSNNTTNTQINKIIVTVPDYLQQNITPNYGVFDLNNISQKYSQLWNFNDDYQKQMQVQSSSKENAINFHDKFNFQNKVETCNIQEIANPDNDHIKKVQIDKNSIPDHSDLSQHYQQKPYFANCYTEVPLEQTQQKILTKHIEMVEFIRKDEVTHNIYDNWKRTQFSFQNKKSTQFVYPSPFVNQEDKKNQNNIEIENQDSLNKPNLQVFHSTKPQYENNTYSFDYHEANQPINQNSQQQQQFMNNQFTNLGEIQNQLSYIDVGNYDNNQQNQIAQQKESKNIDFQVCENSESIYVDKLVMDRHFNAQKLEDVKKFQQPIYTNNNDYNNNKLGHYYELPPQQPVKNQIPYYQRSTFPLQHQQQIVINSSTPNNVSNKKTMHKSASTDNIKKTIQPTPSHPSLMFYAHQMQNSNNFIFPSKQLPNQTQQNKPFSQKYILPSKIYRQPVSIHSQSLKNIINTDKNMPTNITNIPSVVPCYITRPSSQPKPPKQTRIKTTSVQKQTNLQNQPQIQQQYIDHQYLHAEKVRNAIHFDCDTTFNNGIKRQPLSQKLIRKSKNNFLFSVSDPHSPQPFKFPSEQNLTTVRKVSQLYNPTASPINCSEHRSYPPLRQQPTNENRQIPLHYDIACNNPVQKNVMQVNKSSNNRLRIEYQQQKYVKQIQPQRRMIINNNNKYVRKQKISIIAKPQITFNGSQKNMYSQNSSTHNNHIVDDLPINQIYQDSRNIPKTKSKKKIFVLTKQLESARKTMQKAIY